MNFAYDDEQQALLDLAKQILTDGSKHERLKQLEKGGGPRFDPNLWNELAKAGLLGLGVPDSLGGSGFGFLEIAGVAELVGRSAAAVPFLETVVLGTQPIVAFGDEALQRKLLPDIVSGALVVTAALTEPEGDLATPRTQAVQSGGSWKLSGRKLCVPYAEVASLILVPAATGASTQGVFLVDPKSAGVTRTALDTTAGQPESLLELDGAVAQAVLGDPLGGGAIVAWMAERLNAAQASYVLGLCAEAVRLTAEYTTNRKQFGQPIASFQAAGHRAANAYIDTEGVRLTARQAAWRLAQGLPSQKEVAVAKYWAADAGHRVVHAAQHLHGGMGVDRDYPLHRFFLFARQIELTVGNASQQLRHLGKLLSD